MLYKKKELTAVTQYVKTLAAVAQQKDWAQQFSSGVYQGDRWVPGLGHRWVPGLGHI